MRLFVSNVALSTVIANLLMVLIVTSLGATLLLWSNTVYVSVDGERASYVSSLARRTQERFVIEHVWFSDTDTNGLKDGATLYIRNVSELRLTIADAYINQTRITVSSIIEPMQVAAITLALSPELAVDSNLQFVLVSQTGSSTRQSWIVI